MKFLQTLFFLFFCFLSTVLFSQHYYFRTYGLEDGLPQSQVNSVVQDEKGFLWLGTTGGGLCRFDGKIFTSFGLRDGLTDKIIKNIQFDKQGVLWVLTEQGISRMKGKKFISYSYANGLPKTKFSCMTYDQKGNFWVGTPGIGVLKLVFDSNGTLARIIPVNTASGLSSDKVMCVLARRNGDIWIGTNGGGISVIKNGVNSPPPYSINTIQVIDSVNGNNIVFSLLEGYGNNIWIGTNKNAYLWHNNTLKPVILIKYPKILGSGGASIYSIFQDRDGLMWLGSFYGMINYDGGKITWNTLPAGSSGPVWCIYEDREKNVWAGVNSGLVKFSGKRFSNYSLPEGMDNDEIWSITEDNRFNIWLANHRGISKLKKDTSHIGWFDFVAVNFNSGNSQMKSSAKVLLKDYEGKIWIGTSLGIEIVASPDSSRIEFKSFAKNKLKDKSVFHLLQDNRKNIWISTYGDGIYIYPNKENFDYNPQLIHFSKENGLCDNVIRCVYEDADGIFWYATNAGCLGKITFTNPALLSQPVFQSFSEKEGLKNARILSLTGDAKKNLWLGSFAGLCCYDGKNFRWISDEEGLSSTTVYFLLNDGNENLWVGTNMGLDKLDLGEYYNHNKITFRHYGPLDGFTGIECNPNAAYKDHEGNLWFGTVKGAFKYSSDDDIINKIPAKTHITNLRLFFKDFDWSKFSDGNDLLTGLPIDLTLPYDQNHLTFDFTGISLTIPEKVRYRYKLEGLDVEWSPPVTVQSATYSGIPHGKYTFMVKACNNDGIWNSLPVSFSFEITPPFWRAWWFTVSVVSFIIAVIYAIFRIRVRNLQQAKRILEERVKLRTAEISRQKEIIELKNKDIEQKNKDITDSIEYARYLQQAVLPDTKQLKQLLPESFIFFLPKDIISGDFYWFCETNDKIMVAACDCTGHGVSGALLSVLCNNLLFQAVFDHRKTVAGEILAEVNHLVLQALKKEGAAVQANEGMDAALCVIDKKEKYIEYAGAINPLVIVHDGKINEVPGNIHSVGGITEPDFIFTTHKLLPGKDSFMYIFSDGYQSQFGGPKEKKLLKKGFLEIVRNISMHPLDEQPRLLNQTLSDWKKNLEQVDDILVIGFRI